MTAASGVAPSAAGRSPSISIVSDTPAPISPATATSLEAVQKHHVVRTDSADFDGDGKVDAVTETEVSELDTTGDGTVDTVVVTQTTIVDIDGDGVSDMAHRTETIYVDLDGDGTADIARIVEVTAEDSDNDGELDTYQVSEREGFLKDGELVGADEILPEG